MSRRKKASASNAPSAGAPTAVRGAVVKPPADQRVIWMGVALAVITVALFARVCAYPFLVYDDNMFITENAHVKGGFTWANIVWAFTNNDAYLWHPLTWFSHMLDWKIFEDRAWGHHLTSVLIHGVNTVLVFYFLRQLTGSLWRSALVAALFGWHPLHVESVAWIAERKDVLSCCFWFLTLLAYLRYAAAPNAKRYCWVLLWFALGLMSKPMVVTLPCVLLLLDVWPLRRVKVEFAENNPWWPRWPWAELWRLVREKIPMFLMVLGVSLLTVRMMKSSGGLTSTETLSLGGRAANSLTGYARYFGNIFWPTKLTIFYPFPEAWPAWQVAGAALFLIVMSVAAVRLLRAHGYLWTGWFWFAGTLVPTIGLVQNGNQSMADRYTYIPYVGAFIALVWGGAALLEGRPALRKPVLGITGAALLACMGLTTLQIPYWQNTEVLFKRSLAVTERNFIAEAIVGDAYVDKASAALDARNVALAKAAQALDAHDVAGAQTNKQKAEEHYRQAGENYREAEAYYRRALAINPRLYQAAHNLAGVMMNHDRKAEAVALYQQALKYQPYFPESNVAMGTIMINDGKAAEAVEYYLKALPRAPRSAEARAGLGMAYGMLGQLEAAERELRLAMALGDSPTVRNNLANVLVMRKQSAEAALHYRAALSADPNWTLPLNSLARLMAISADPAVRNGPEAVKLAERLCAITGNKQPAYLDSLAAAYAEAGRFGEALATIQKAIGLAATSGQAAVVKQLQANMLLYQSGQPLRESP